MSRSLLASSSFLPPLRLFFRSPPWSLSFSLSLWLSSLSLSLSLCSLLSPLLSSPLLSLSLSLSFSFSLSLSPSHSTPHSSRSHVVISFLFPILWHMWVQSGAYLFLLFLLHLVLFISLSLSLSLPCVRSRFILHPSAIPRCLFLSFLLSLSLS